MNAGLQTLPETTGVVIVSGGSRGLGACIVQDLLDHGYFVCSFSRSSSARIETWQADPALQGRFYFETLDAGHAEAVRSYVRTVRDKFGRIDFLVNNAAIARDGVFALMTDSDFQQLLQINLGGCFLLTREVARQMLVQRKGGIVNISSIVGLSGFSGLAAYSATKAGLFGLTHSLARELGSRNIRVNAIAPGFLETEMSEGLAESQRKQIERRTPLGRLGTPEDVVPVVR
ncbi:MAG: SDR family NAD(P)-dependent oxidoreductase, partial [Planctomycetota bacterium]|nr:SDR family NAD(P)-dependent oxidoreductase [Planctomycetota bacterium]